MEMPGQDYPGPMPILSTVWTMGTLPATGRTIPLLAAGVAVGIALLLRAGRSRLDDDPTDDDDGDG